MRKEGLGRNEGLGSWPARRARMTPHRTAIKHDGATISYAGWTAG